MTGQARVGSHAVFTVRTHPKLRDVWPGEPGGAFDKPTTVPLGGEDILRDVFYYAPVAGAKPNVALSTDFRGTKHTRDLLIDDPHFASDFARWLRKHEGKSIADIGNLLLDMK